MKILFVSLLLLAAPGGEEKFDFVGLDCKQSWTFPKTDPKRPVFSLRCEKFGKRTFSIKDYGGDKFYPSVDGKFLLAVSNSELHKYAYWIVNRVGDKIAHKAHGDSSLQYCDKSKNWVKLNEAPVFEIVEDNLKSVFVKTCDDKTINLIEKAK